jgi:hypothetical protein
MRHLDSGAVADHDVTYVGGRHKAVGLGLAAAALVLLLTQMASTAQSVVYAYMVVVAAAAVALAIAAARAARTGITLDDRGVTIHQAWSTRSWRWDELRSADTLDRSKIPRAINPMPGRYKVDKIEVLPVLTLTSGKKVILPGLRTTLGNASDFSWVDDAFQEIRRRIAARSGSGGG